ncbi:MAG TPA: hypothetical protein VIL49_11710, partial [Capillimicrobium sp.]
APAPRRRSRLGARLGGAMVLLTVLGAIALGVYAGINSVYFIGSDDDGRVALFKGLPYELPLGIELYRTEYRTGIPTTSLQPPRQVTVREHEWRSHSDAVEWIRQLELGQLQGS